MPFFSFTKGTSQYFHMKIRDYQKLIDSLPCGLVQVEKIDDIWRTVYISDGYFKITGEDSKKALKENLITIKQSSFHPEDIEFIYKTVKQAIINKTSFSLEARLKHISGYYVWVRMEGSSFFSQTNNIMLRLIIIDITTSHNLQNALETRTKTMEAISSLTANNLFEYDHCSKIFKLTLKDKSTLVQNEPIETYINSLNSFYKVIPEDIQKQNQLIKEILIGKPILSASYRIEDEKTENAIKWIQLKGKTLYSKDGLPNRTVGIISNITEEKLSEQKKEEEARRDPLTKLFNIKNMQEEVKKKLDQANLDKILPLLLIDLDGFKNVNETHGLLFGNEILINLAEGLTSICPAGTILGRIGDDEFVALLPETDTPLEANTISKSIHNIFNIVQTTEIRKQDISSSIGIAIWPKDGTTFEQLLSRSDVALTKAKQQGGNRTCFYQGELIEDFSSDRFFKTDNDTKEFESESFNTEITEFTMDILAQTKDVSSAIRILLRKIGRYFSLDRVAIKEKLSMTWGLKTSYEWCQAGTKSTLQFPMYMTEEQWIDMKKNYNEDSLFISKPVSDDLSNEEKKELMNQRGICSYIHYGIFDNNSMIGTISFEKNTFGFNWSKEQIKTIKTIAKILSVYLLKIRAFTNAQKLVEQLTLFDSLTGLMNLDHFKNKVIEILKKTPTSQRFVILNFDIQNFKYLNEHHGYEKGDDFLKTIANYISSLPTTCYACRSYSDNFIVLSKIKATTNSEIIETIINNYIVDFLNSQKSKYPECNLTITAGCAEFHYPQEPIEKTIDNAHSIRKMMKENFVTGCKVYDNEIAMKLHKEAELINSIPNACKNGEFFFQLQPKVALSTGKIEGAEALVRWNHPRGEVVQPGGFIPQLEKTGLITQVDFFIYREVCRYIQSCLKKGIDFPIISVNVSRAHLSESDFVSKILNLVSCYNIPPEKLEFELTENIFLDNPLPAIKILTELRTQGFKISIDDFGAGYSSINLLKDLTIDVLKLDKSFLDVDILKEADVIVITSMIQMAKKLHITVLCEGAETKEQVSFLKNASCDLVQGYYFSRPISVEAFTKLYTDNPYFESV